MDWISFLWGVGAILFVNTVYTIWALPKQLKRKSELNNKYDELVSKYESFAVEYEEKLVALDKKRDEVSLALETVKSSLKLRKSCPACGAEFPLYILGENVNVLGMSKLWARS